MGYSFKKYRLVYALYSITGERFGTLLEKLLSTDYNRLEGKYWAILNSDKLKKRI